MDSVDELLAAASEKRHTPLLRTKVQISARVTVFLAAAGFGKTYAMMDACEKVRREGASVAWFSCAALALPSGEILDRIRQFFDLFAEAETIFIDDLAALSPGQRKALLHAFVLTAPHRKIVLATRSIDDLGLARLLADGALQLIQADTLRWRRRQLSELWQSRLTARQINFINDFAQGWPAISQLLARFIVKGGDPVAEAVLLNASLVADYIRTEVLASFKSSDIPLLSMTSLIDAFDDALIKRLAGNSTLTCDELVRRLPGLCNYQEGGARVAYNRALLLYLQRVFATLPDNARFQALRHAADWTSAKGDVVSAVNLAARAGDQQRIVDYVTKAGGQKIQDTKGSEALREVLAAAGEELVAQEPRLKLLKCIILLKDGRVREATRLYQEVAPVLPSDAGTEREAVYVRLCLVVCGCQVSTMTDAEVRRAARSFDQDPAFRELVPTILAIIHSQQADFGAATAEISLARVHARNAGTTYNLLFLDIHSAVVALACGNLEEARTYLSRARLRWRKGFPNDHAAETVMLSLGVQLAFERGNISQARRLIGQVGHRLAHSESWLDIYFAGYEPMFRLLAREQGLPTALAAIDRALSQMRDAGLVRIAIGLRNIGTCLIGEEILRGAGGMSLSMDDDDERGVSESWQEIELRLLASAYGGLVNRRPDHSRHALDSLIAFAEQHGLLRTKLRALLLRQIANDFLRDANSAIADFHAALEIGARTGMRQAFLEFGAAKVKARIAAGVPERFLVFAKGLSSLLAPSSKRSEGLLTRREAQILELLTGGGSDKGIARKLQVTEYAVRFHLKNIYRKFGVHDRNSAINHHRPEVNRASKSTSESCDLPL